MLSGVEIFKLFVSDHLKLFLNILCIGPDAFYLTQPKDYNFELKCPTNMALSDRLLMV